MADEVWEMAAKITPEGVDEAADDLEGMGEQFEETADTAGESAGQLEEFAQKWEGAMTAIVAGLAVAAIGLASKIPVVGEAMAGLEAIITSIALKMDQFLRPVLSPLSNAFFKLSNAIDQTEGPLADLIGLLGTAVTTFGALAAATWAANAALVAFKGTVASLFGPLQKGAAVASFLGGKLATLVAGSVAAQAAVGALVGLFGVWVLETTGVLDAVRNLGRAIGDLLSPALRDLILTLQAPLAPLAALGAALVEVVRGDLQGAVDAAQRVLEIYIGAWERTLDRVAQLLQAMGAIILTNFEMAFDLALSAVKQGMNDIIATIEAGVNRAINALNRLPNTNIGRVSLGRFETRSAQQIGQAGQQRLNQRLQGNNSQLAKLIQTMQQNEVSFSINLDSKELASDTQPFMDQGVANRGRPPR